MKKSIYAFIAAAAVFSSCAKEIQEAMPEVQQEKQTLMTKLVGGTQGELVPGSVLVKLSEETATEMRAGNAAAFAGIEGISISPALPVQPKNMEVARKYELHQWFSVTFDAAVPHEKMAMRLASLSEVKAVQYNRFLEPIRDDRVEVFEPVMMTRSAEAAPQESQITFNDPYARNQWNLVNDGSLAEDAVEGADVGVKDAWKLTGILSRHNAQLRKKTSGAVRVSDVQYLLKVIIPDNLPAAGSAPLRQSESLSGVMSAATAARNDI